MFSNTRSRFLFTTLCAVGGPILACPAFAETFDGRSLVTAATLYPQGAMITREAVLSLPAGQHEIHFADIPLEDHYVDELIGMLQIDVAGAAAGPVQYDTASVGDRVLYRSEAEKAAKAHLDTLEDQLREATADIDAIRLEAAAAEDTLAYLGRLADAEGADAAEKAATALMIREQSLSARLAKQDAEQRAKAAEKGLDDLKEEIRQAGIALDRLVPSDADRLAITLPVAVAQAGEVQISFSYMAGNAAWMPVYTAELDTEAGTLDLTRSVAAIQKTGEPWFDVALSFATDYPNRDSEPDEVSERIRRIYEPLPMKTATRSIQESDATGYSEPAMEMAAVVVDSRPQVNISGLSQTYVAPRPVRLYSDEDGTKFDLAAVSLTPEIFLRAVPLYEEEGFLIASFTNDTGEMLVPGEVQLIRDGVSLGRTSLDTLVNGDEAELAFGAVQGVSVERTLLSRNEGDRGVISKSNESGTEWRIDVTNRTARSWPVEVVDRVSVSEQEDLKIDWSAEPRPDVTNRDEKRGVLAWHFDLEPGARQSISLSESLRWPDGQELR